LLINRPNNNSIKARFGISIITNILRSGLSFITGMIIARNLGPENYGNYSFLIGSFIAIRQIVELGTSTAFYTFISQKTRSYNFYLYYIIWQLFQFLVVLLLITALFPDQLIAIIWKGHDRSLIAIAFISSFLINHAWHTVVSIGESLRKTIIIQLSNLFIAVFHLLFIYIAISVYTISVRNLLILIIVEYLFAIIITPYFLRNNEISKNQKPDSKLNEIIKEYFVYCSPLVIFSVFSFIYEFSDRWLLQNYGGSVQQGYYAIAYKFTIISLIATTSMVKVFWKEIAEAYKQKNNKKIKRLYQKSTRILFFIGCVISCFLIPWSKNIVNIFLGSDYKYAWLPLSIMFCYPLHQSLGQITSVLFMAIEKTKEYVLISNIFLILSIPITYFMVAPSSAIIPGLGMGATGIAIKMVALQFININIQIFWLAKYFKWEFDWAYQLINISSLLILSYISKIICNTGINILNVGTNIYLIIFLTGIIYFISVLSFLYYFPGLAGTSRKEMSQLFRIIWK